MIQIPRLRVLALALVPPLGVLCTVALAHLVRGVPFTYLTRDPATLGGLHPLMGSVSMLGIILWAAAAAVSLLAALHLVRRGAAGAGFYVASGALSAWLMFDDAFLFHEVLAPDHLGISNEVVLAGLALATAAWLGIYRAAILKAGPFFLILALGFFALSLGVDAVADNAAGDSEDVSWRIFLEDGPKWMGITCWLAFHVNAALFALDEKTVQSR